jgi:hypothetical protein
MPFKSNLKKKPERPALGVTVAVTTSAEVIHTPRAPTTASAVAQPPPLPCQHATPSFTVPLTLPSSPPSPTHLRLRVRHLDADRFIQLELPKEARLSSVKRQAMERFGLLLGESKSGVRASADAEEVKGKRRPVIDEEDVLNISVSNSPGFEPRLVAARCCSALSSQWTAQRMGTKG